MLYKVVTCSKHYSVGRDVYYYMHSAAAVAAAANALLGGESDSRCFIRGGEDE